MTQPFLSIVTVSYNQAPYLRQCVESVLSQKDSDVEYIVVDPGSTDGSREILARYGDAIDHLVTEPDQGPAEGLNKGFALAAGEVGYFINSDDFILPGAIDKMRRLWREHAAIDVLLGGCWMVDGRGAPLRELRSVPAGLSELVEGHAPVVQQGLSFRLQCYRSVGGFNTENRTCWDYELLCDLMAHGAKVKTARDRIGAFRLHDAGLSGGAGGAAHERRYAADLARIRLCFGQYGGDTSSLLHGRALALLRHCLRPLLAFGILRDRLLPDAMHKRWHDDQQQVGTGVK